MVFTDGNRVPEVDALAIRRDSSRALGPDRANRCQPLIKHGAESSRATILNTPELIRQTELTKDQILPVLST